MTYTWYSITQQPLWPILDIVSHSNHYDLYLIHRHSATIMAYTWYSVTQQPLWAILGTASHWPRWGYSPLLKIVFRQLGTSPPIIDTASHKYYNKLWLRLEHLLLRIVSRQLVMSSPLLGTVPPAVSSVHHRLGTLSPVLNTSSHNMSVSLEHKLLQAPAIFPSHLYMTHRHTTTIMTPSRSSSNTRSAEWPTTYHFYLIHRHLRTIITTSRWGSNTRSYRLTDIFACRQLVLLHRHTTFIVTCRWYSNTLTRSLSCHVIGYAAPPYFAHHPYLTHRSTATTSVSVWFRHPITSSP